MSLYDLSTLLEHLKEETTMGDIAYLPSGLGAVKAAVRSLARLKKDWNIEILEGPKGRRVVFEDALSVYVPYQYWNDFESMLGAKLEKGVIDLEKHLQEAYEEDIERLQKEIKPALAEFYGEAVFKAVEKVSGMWRARFGVLKRDKINAPVSVEYKEKDIQAIVSRLLSAYGDDKGNLELLLDAIRDNEPLNAFEVFRDYDFLYGTRIISQYHKVRLIFEAVLDMSYIMSQSVIIDEQDVIDQLEADVRDIKIVRNVVFPKGDTFTNRFFREIKNAIGDLE